MRRSMWVVFAACVIAATNLSGLDWSLKLSGDYDFQCVACFSEGVGVITTGDEIIWTNNYCDSLYYAEVLGPRGDWQDVYAVDENVGYAVGSDYMAKTTDGGMTWNTQRVGTGCELRGVHFFDETHGIVVGRRLVVITHNSGETWDTVTTGLENRVDVSFKDDGSYGYIVHNGSVDYSNDEGYTWEERSAPSIYQYSICITDDDKVWVSGRYGLFRSDDYGFVWDTYSTHEWPNCVCFFNNNIGYAGGGAFGDGDILETTNGGNSWTIVYSPSTNIHDMDLWPSGSALAAGATSSNGKIYFGYNPDYVHEPKKELPTKLFLSISPNPFNSSCAITASEGATIEIYDLRGNVVGTHPCVRPSQGQTHRSVPTNGTFFWQPNESISSGVYLIRATKGGETITKRAVLMK